MICFSAMAHRFCLVVVWLYLLLTVLLWFGVWFGVWFTGELALLRLFRLLVALRLRVFSVC